MNFCARSRKVRAFRFERINAQAPAALFPTATLDDTTRRHGQIIGARAGLFGAPTPSPPEGCKTGN